MSAKARGTRLYRADNTVSSTVVVGSAHGRTPIQSPKRPAQARAGSDSDWTETQVLLESPFELPSLHLHLHSFVVLPSLVRSPRLTKYLLLCAAVVLLLVLSLLLSCCCSSQTKPNHLYPPRSRNPPATTGLSLTHPFLFDLEQFSPFWLRPYPF